MHQQNKQQGAALLIVLLLLAIMVSVAATMSQRLFTQFQRAHHQLDYQQAYWYSLAVESLAQVAIEQSYKDSDLTTLNQVWAHQEQRYPLEDGQVIGVIYDRQSCFNLNAFYDLKTSLTDEKPYLYSVWIALLSELDVEGHQAELVADSLWDFVDANQRVNRVYGAEDDFYQSMQPSYLTANTLLVDASELRAVQGVSAKLWEKVQPYVCALPDRQWKLNVNTLKPQQAPLLAALFYPHLGLDNAKSLIEQRPYDGWSSLDQLLTEGALSALDAGLKEKAKPYLSLDSHYFELDAQIEVQESQLRVRSLLHSANKKTVKVVRRRFGGISERSSEHSVN